MSLGKWRHIHLLAVRAEQEPKDLERKEQAGYMLAGHILGRGNNHRSLCKHLLVDSRLTYT